MHGSRQPRAPRPCSTASPPIPSRRAGHATYRLGARLRRGRLISEYATDDRTIRVVISRTPDPAADDLAEACRRLAHSHLEAFGPRVVDRGATAGRAWAAYRLPAGLHTLAGARRTYEGGLDGRDWAWMARRILMTLDGAGDPARPGLGLDTVLIEPARHGVVLTGFGDEGLPPAELFDAVLGSGPDAAAQRRWARGATAAHLPAATALHEYDLLLTRLYGVRRYRRFCIPQAA